MCSIKVIVNPSKVDFPVREADQRTCNSGPLVYVGLLTDTVYCVRVLCCVCLSVCQSLVSTWAGRLTGTEGRWIVISTKGRNVYVYKVVYPLKNKVLLWNTLCLQGTVGRMKIR